MGQSATVSTPTPLAQIRRRKRPDSVYSTTLRLAPGQVWEARYLVNGHAGARRSIQNCSGGTLTYIDAKGKEHTAATNTFATWIKARDARLVEGADNPTFVMPELPLTSSAAGKIAGIKRSAIMNHVRKGRIKAEQPDGPGGLMDH